MPQPVPDFLKLLAHDVRWQLISQLTSGDYRVQELTEALQRPQNLVSYHLRQLREQKLVSERRSSADGRDVYYRLDVRRLQRLYQASGQALHPALGKMATSPAVKVAVSQPTAVLFLCTHNSARSQLAEGILRAVAPSGMVVQSAGSAPTAVHPLAIRAALALNIDISHQTATHLEQIIAHQYDYVITVCDQVREICPTLPATTQQTHWSIPDPSAHKGSDQERYHAFLQTAQELQTRILYWLMRL